LRIKAGRNEPVSFSSAVKRFLVVGAVLAALSTAAGAATFSIRSTDSDDEGFNDLAVFAPVGGNNATTLGQARMNVLLEAARIWGLILNSNVTIQVDAAFDPQTCSATSGTLGSAGPRAIYRNFGGGVSPNTYYVSALADAIAGTNLASTPSNPDIGATFNSNVDGDVGCLGGRGFYYGFDHNRGNKVDLLLVVLHEFGHGLGFTSQVTHTTGQGFVGSDGVMRFDSFTHKLFDEQFNAAWPALTDAQRIESATHTGLLVWGGANVNAQSGRYTQGVTVNGRVRMYAPATLSSGSSVSHFDTLVTPSVLMEPNLPSSITTSSTDITACALQDIGWTVTVCPHDGSNRPPVANSQSLNAIEDQPITITLTGSDPDNNALTFAVVTQPTSGSLSAISSATPRTVVYTPNANANGVDSFAFTVNDGTLTSATASVSINIAGVNDAPTAQDLAVIAQPGQPLAITLAASDVDGDTLNFTVVSQPTHGTLSGAGATLTYRANNGYLGPDSFTYRASDATLNSAAATVTISVQAAPTVVSAGSSGGGGGAVTDVWAFIMSSLLLLRAFSKLIRIQRGNRFTWRITWRIKWQMNS
jgi:hypothetical protein